MHVFIKMHAADRSTVTRLTGYFRQFAEAVVAYCLRHRGVDSCGAFEGMYFPFRLAAAVCCRNIVERVVQHVDVNPRQTTWDVVSRVWTVRSCAARVLQGVDPSRARRHCPKGVVEPVARLRSRARRSSIRRRQRARVRADPDVRYPSTLQSPDRCPSGNTRAGHRPGPRVFHRGAIWPVTGDHDTHKNHRADECAKHGWNGQKKHRRHCRNGLPELPKSLSKWAGCLTQHIRK